MNGDTYITSEKLNNKEVVFIIGNTPTVTFNDNVTVYTYPKVNYSDAPKINENMLLKIIKQFKQILKRV